MFCEEQSAQKCLDCSTEFASAPNGWVYFCSTCALRTHQKKNRKDHKLQDAIDTDRLELYKLDLLSVICIETSHYVCFTRDPRDDTERKWIFFDSMADRQCEFELQAFTSISSFINSFFFYTQMTHTTFPK